MSATLDDDARDVVLVEYLRLNFINNAGTLIFRYLRLGVVAAIREKAWSCTSSLP